MTKRTCVQVFTFLCVFIYIDVYGHMSNAMNYVEVRTHTHICTFVSIDAYKQIRVT